MCLNNCLVLKLTFIKASYFVSVKQNQMKMSMQSIFGCNVGSYPFRCLGIPIQVRKLNNKNWKVIVERLEKKLSSWKGKMSSARVRLVLINSVVFSLSMFMMSFFRSQEGSLKKQIIIDLGSLGRMTNTRKKYKLAKWSLLCQPKD
jgi:hypothetical protein